MNTELVKAWNKLDNYDKLEIIENGIEFSYTSEGSLWFRLFRDGEIMPYMGSSATNHLCSEAVSQDTLIELFGKGHEFDKEEDAEIILNWMNEQV
jgi:hypothetical protein